MTLKEVTRAFTDIFSAAGINRLRVRRVLLFSFSVYGMFIISLGYAWYSQQWGSSFHFFDDAAEWKQMDKFAHFFWSFQAAALATRLFSWAKLDDRGATLMGVLLGFAFVSSIEVLDGFSESYGASLFDILANALGCSVFAAQRILWKTVSLWPKFSFHPTSFAPLRPEMLGNGLLEEILKDYNGQTFWYSVSIKQIPLPGWLVIAVGVGAEGMVYGRDPQNELMNFSPYRKFFLSVDLNLSQVQTSSKILNAGLYVLNIIKIPAPTLEFSSHGIKFHPIYF